MRACDHRRARATRQQEGAYNRSASGHVFVGLESSIVLKGTCVLIFNRGVELTM